MSKNKIIFSLCCVLLLITLIKGQAQDTKKPETAKFQLELVYVAGTDPHEFVWQVDALPRTKFKSLSSVVLRDWVASLSPGSTIDFSPSCLRMGGEPSGDQIKEFQAFCKAEDIKFVVHPSG